MILRNRLRSRIGSEIAEFEAIGIYGRNFVKPPDERKRSRRPDFQVTRVQQADELILSGSPTRCRFLRCIRGDLSFHLGCEFNPRLPSPLTYSSSRLLAICIPNTILSDFDDYAGMPGRSNIVLAGYNGFGVDGHGSFNAS